MPDPVFRGRENAGADMRIDRVDGGTADLAVGGVAVSAGPARLRTLRRCNTEWLVVEGAANVAGRRAISVGLAELDAVGRRRAVAGAE